MTDAARVRKAGLSFSDDDHDPDGAKSVCRYRCAVLAECREWQNRLRLSHGIWPGRAGSAGSGEHAIVSNG